MIALRNASFTRWFRLAFAALILQLGETALLAEDAAGQRAEQLFAHRVLVLFKTKCFACHGEDPNDVRGEFNMLSRAGLLRGGESKEPSIVAGKPEESSLYRAVNWDGLEMPPKENDRLTEQQIGFVKDWIAGGAPWPAEQRLAELRREGEKGSAAGGVSVRTSGGLSAEWTGRKYKPKDLWAYRPLRPGRGGQSDPAADRNSIDRLIQQRLNQVGLAPAPAADRRTLIRRATFDLTGLPPKPAEIAEFVDDPAPDEEAFAKLVERLLASPHYGEQWGRHWLDVVRYADSSGYANDFERGNAWRYRDYVVRAFNSDKPYDQFIREQLAGDELDADNAENLIAVGFLRMGPWELTGMEVAKVARQRFLDDVTDAVGQVFLGHMLQCAKCHDHKFDPVPTRDYYSLQAVFATTQMAERRAGFLPQENTAGFDEQQYLQRRQRYCQETLRELKRKHTLQAARAWCAERGVDAAPFEKVVAELTGKEYGSEARVDLAEVRRILAERGVDPATIPPRHVGFEPRDFGLERIAKKGLQRLTWRLERYQPFALSVYSGRTPNTRSVSAPLRIPKSPLQSGELQRTSILAGGDPFSPKEAVAPGTLSAVDKWKEAAGASPLPSALPREIVGRRRALAEWIAAPGNPLTARVMVNRIWQWHFGRAIAGNPNNFGATGKKPTHPELLDWLAVRFIQQGWSIKAMHRSIMNSAAYRRAAQHPDPAALAEKDANGVSYAVFRARRLAAEELRDAMLQVSGELNPALGGIPARPEMNLEAALQPRQVMGTFAEAWQPSPLPEQRHRRSLYALRIRGQRDPFLEVFNAPSSDLSCEAREASTVTPQVFALFNSRITFDRALALANRVLQEQPKGRRDSAAVIRRLFQLVYGRTARPDEVRLCLDHWKQMTTRHESLEFQSPVYPREVVREAVEENTGEKFQFTEPLEFFADFVPDLKPADVGPPVRGLAEVCLVLLNSNEFAYVY